MAICHIALGGNVGDVFATMERGLDLLDKADGVSVTKASPVYLTTPVGPCSGNAFLNAAATLDYELEPLTLLQLLKSVEESVGRESDRRWGPRPLDLDLLLISDTLVNEPPLKVPHPHMWYRRFVLDPLVEIAPNAVHLMLDETVSTMRDRLMQRPLPISLQGLDSNGVLTVARRLSETIPSIEIVAEHDSKLHRKLVAITLNLDENHSQDLVNWRTRVIRLSDLPGSIEEATDSVLTAALDEPVRQSRPLRRMP